jgi:formate/nitrite transporter FocA (FNT family)
MDKLLKQFQNELARTSLALALSGVAAGPSMGFSFLIQALLQAGRPDTVWRGGRLPGCGFPRDRNRPRRSARRHTR